MKLGRKYLSNTQHHGGGGSSVLSGATGRWRAADYTTSPRRRIPNRITNPSGVMDQNILNCPRRCFSTAKWLRSNITTTTDNIAAAPDGSTEASTIERTTSTAVWTVYNSAVLTAGQYTIGLSVRYVSGDATFSLQLNTTGTVQTATSSWQRFSYTATVTAGTKFYGMNSPAAGSIAKFEICDMEIFPGAVDLNTTWATLKPLTVRNMDMDVGTHGNNQTTGSVSGGVLTFGSVGTIPLSAVTAFGSSAFTLMYVASKNAGGADNTNQGGLAHLTTGASLAFGQRNSPHVGLYLGTTALLAANAGFTSGITGLQDIDSLVGRSGVKPFVMSGSYNGTSSAGYFNGVKLFGKTQAATSQNIADLVFNACPMYDHHEIIYFNRELTAAEQLSVYTELAALYTIPASSIVVFEGDSLTAGTISYTNWPGVMAMSLTKNIFGAWAAVTGSVTVNATPSAGMTGRAAALDTILVNKGSLKAVLTVYIGANDLTNAARDTWLTNLAAYLDSRWGSGGATFANPAWNIGLVIPTPRTVASGGDALFETARQYVMPIMRGWVGSHCHFIIDFGGDATLGPFAAAADTTYYSDGLHFTSAAITIAAGIAKTAIEANIP